MTSPASLTQLALGIPSGPDIFILSVLIGVPVGIGAVLVLVFRR